MLLGKDLRRGHERRLVPGFHGQQHGGEGDHRFPRADVAMQEPVHGPGRGQVAPDLGHRALLRARERERQFPVERLH